VEVTAGNKELKCELSADRFSGNCHMANCFRTFLHCLAHNLLGRARQALPEPTLPKLRAELPPEARPTGQGGTTSTRITAR
jgi:hypothetical protein